MSEGPTIRELFVKLGLDFDNSEMEKADRGIAKLKAGALALASAFATGAVAAGIKAFTHDIINAASDLSNLAGVSALTRAELQTLSTLTKTAGVDMRGLAQGARDLAIKMAEAGRNGGEAAAFFDSIGFSIRDSNGHIRSGSDALLGYLDAVAAMPNAADRAMALNKIGGDFKKLAPLVANGRNELRDFHDEMGEGGGLTADVIEQANALEVEYAKLDLRISGVKNTIAAALLPIMSRLANWTGKLVDGFQSLAKNSKIVESAITVLGIAIAAAGYMALKAWIVPIAMFAAIAAAIGLVILIIDDFWTALSGGDSLFAGPIIDGFKAIGAWAKDVWDRVIKFLDPVITYYRIMGKALVAIFLTAFNLIKGIFVWWWEHVTKPILDFLIGGFQKAWDLITDGAAAAFSWIKSNVIDPIVAMISRVAKAFGAMLPDNLAEKIEGFLDNVIQVEASAALTRGGGALASAIVPPVTAGNTISQSNQTTIHVNGGNPEEIRRVIRQENAKRDREAAAALIPVGRVRT